MNSKKTLLLAALSVVVLSALAAVVWRSHRQKIVAEQALMQAQLDRLHFMGLQSFTKTIEIQSALGVGGELAKDKGLQTCFEGKGRNCTQRATQWAPFTQALSENSSPIDVQGYRCQKDCFVLRQTQYRIRCSNDSRCEGVEFRLSTTPLQARSVQPRTSAQLVAGMSLAIDPRAIQMLQALQEKQNRSRVQSIISNLKIAKPKAR